MRYLRGFLSAQKRNIKQLYFLVLVNFTIAGIGFVTQVKIANVLGRESFGLIAYGVVIATYCGVVIRFGLDRTLVRDLIHYPGRFAATVKASLIIRFTLLTLVIALVLGWKLFQPSTGDITWGVVLIIVANAAMSVNLQSVYDSWHQMSRHALYNLLQRSLYFMVIWFIVINNPEALSVFSIGLATFVSVFIYLVFQYSWAMKRLTADDAGEKLAPLAFNMARRNVLLLLAAFAGLSFGPLNQLVLENYHGTAELGGFAAAWMMVTLVNMFLSQVARIGNPAIARITTGSVTRQEKIQFLMKYVAVMSMMTLPVMMVVISVPTLILGALFRPEYITAAPTLQVLSVYVLIFSVGLVASQYMVSSRMEKSYTACVLSGAGIAVVASILLIPSMGGLGAAWALLVSHGFSIALYWYKIIVSLKLNDYVHEI